MDRVDLEALVVRLIDQVQRSGAAAEYDVEDPSSLQELLRQEAQNRGLHIHTGTVTADEHAVWAYLSKESRPLTKQLACPIMSASSAS